MTQVLIVLVMIAFAAEALLRRLAIAARRPQAARGGGGMNILLRWLGLEQGADVHRAIDGSWRIGQSAAAGRDVR